MSNSLAVNQSQSVSGLGTFAFTVVTGGEYTLSCQSTLPAGSALQIVLQQNSTPLVTIGGSATNPTPTQPALGSSVRILAVAGDVVEAILTSSANVDALPNGVKSTINLYQGI